MTTWITNVTGIVGHDLVVQFHDQMGREFVVSRKVLEDLLGVPTPKPEITLGGLEVTHWDQLRDRISHLTGKTYEQKPPKNPRPILKLVWDSKKVDRD